MKAKNNKKSKIKYQNYERKKINNAINNNSLILIFTF